MDCSVVAITRMVHMSSTQSLDNVAILSSVNNELQTQMSWMFLFFFF